jgi:hypothetical protein
MFIKFGYTMEYINDNEQPLVATSMSIEAGEMNRITRSHESGLSKRSEDF